MITYTERNIQKEDVELFRRIQYVVNMMELPDIGNDKNGRKIEVSCHMMAEAASRVYDVEVRHGYFVQGYEHSWLCTKNFNIIDVYPVGMVGGPFLITNNIRGPIYIVMEDLDYIRSSLQDYWYAVDLVEASMRKTLECCA